jgi:hypothetical protein
MIQFVAVVLVLLLVVLPLLTPDEALHTHVEPYVPMPIVDVAITSTSGNVTVALTGVSATGSVGSLTPSTTVALTGVSATGSVGSVSTRTL